MDLITTVNVGVETKIITLDAMSVASLFPGLSDVDITEAWVRWQNDGINLLINKLVTDSLQEDYFQANVTET